MRIARLTLAAVALLASAACGHAAEDACRKVLEDRIRSCTEECVARAKAAVDPEIRDRILGYGCQTNCAKLEMFNGHSCAK